MQRAGIRSACRGAVRVRRDSRPVAQETTPAMVAAAEKEGKVVWYTAVDVKVAEAVAKVFRADYPNIRLEVERSGSERVFQRVNQEYQSNIKNVDVVNSSDASHFIFWKQQKWLASTSPPDVQRFPGAVQGPGRLLTPFGARRLSVMGYNTNLVPATNAPTGYADLLDPQWKGKMAKSHPGYSGTSLTGTSRSSKVLGWDYLEKLSKQGVQQLQSTTATPKSIASGERAVMVDGNEYNMFIEIDAKSPVKIIYAEGRNAVRHFAHGDLRRRSASERGARAAEFPLHRESAAAAGRTKAARARSIRM